MIKQNLLILESDDISDYYKDKVNEGNFSLLMIQGKYRGEIMLADIVLYIHDSGKLTVSKDRNMNFQMIKNMMDCKEN